MTNQEHWETIPDQVDYPQFHILDNKNPGDALTATWSARNDGSEEVEIRLRIIFDGVGLVMGSWVLLPAPSQVTPVGVSGTIPIGTLPGPHGGRLRFDVRRLNESQTTVLDTHDFTVNVL